MELSKQKNEIFDPNRKKWVCSQPEERIRQAFVKKLIEEGYPPSYIALEKELFSLPHLQNLDEKLPARRADIIVFAKDIHPKFSLYPLLLVECKSTALNDAFIRQVIGYNTFVQAPFIALVNSSQILFGKYEKEKITFAHNLPSYLALLQAIQGKSAPVRSHQQNPERPPFR